MINFWFIKRSNNAQVEMFYMNGGRGKEKKKKEEKAKEKKIDNNTKQSVRTGNISYFSFLFFSFLSSSLLFFFHFCKNLEKPHQFSKRVWCIVTNIITFVYKLAVDENSTSFWITMNRLFFKNKRNANLLYFKLAIAKERNKKWIDK